MRSYIYAAFVLLVLPATAGAEVLNVGNVTLTNGPSTIQIHYTANSIQGGLIRYDVGIDGLVGQYETLAIQNLGFTGIINQDAFQLSKAKHHVDNDDDAYTYDGARYDAALDSYFLGNFAGTITDTSSFEGAVFRTYQGSASVSFDNRLIIPVAQIVAADPNVLLTGAVVRNGVVFSVPSNSVLSAPEPSTLALAAIGTLAVALTTARRRLA